jgi:p-aminobenzoyl-glutamate transporter AbgT
MTRKALPFAAAVALPSVIFAVIYLTQGENPVFGLVAGAIGLLGAFSAELVRVVQDHRDALSDLESYRADPAATIARWQREDGRNV